MYVGPSEAVKVVVVALFSPFSSLTPLGVMTFTSTLFSPLAGVKGGKETTSAWNGANEPAHDCCKVGPLLMLYSSMQLVKVF